MEGLRKEIVFSIAINLLKFAGETKHYTSAKVYLLRLFNCSIIILVCSFIFLNFFHATAEECVEGIQGLISALQVLLKYIVLMSYKSDIESLIRDTINNFHKYENRNGINNRHEKIFITMKNVQILASIIVLITFYSYASKPIFNSKYIFILSTSVPDSFAISTLILISQYYLICISVIIILSYDLIYFALCVHVILQVRSLKDSIRKLPNLDCYKRSYEVITCIDYHQVLLSIYSRMKIVYSVLLFFHYFVTVINTCCILFLFIRDTGLSTVLIRLSSLSFLFGQFACYTFPAEKVASEFEDMSNAVYMSKWYLSNTTFQKWMLFVMMKSQQIQYFSGIGLIDINLDTFASVLRKTFTFYTVLRNLVNK